MDIKTKHSVGDRIFVVNRYPIGARVLEGTILWIEICIRKRFTQVNYKLNVGFLGSFPESMVYSTREEAEKVRQDWIDKINKADED